MKHMKTQRKDSILTYEMKTPKEDIRGYLDLIDQRARNHKRADTEIHRKYMDYFWMMGMLNINTHIRVHGGE